MKSALHKFTTGFAGVTEDAVLDAVAASGAAGADDAERLGNKGFFDAASSSVIIFLGAKEGAVNDGGGGTSIFFGASFGFDGAAATGAENAGKSGALAGAAAPGGGGTSTFFAAETGAKAEADTTGGAETVLSMRFGGIRGSMRRSGCFKTSRFISETTTRGCLTSVLIARSIASLCEVVGTSTPRLSSPLPLEAVPGVLNMTPDDNAAKRCLPGVSIAFTSTLPSFPTRTSASYPNSRRSAIVVSKRSF